MIDTQQLFEIPRCSALATTANHFALYRSFHNIWGAKHNGLIRPEDRACTRNYARVANNNTQGPFG